MENTLRLRYHHLPEIYAYMFCDSREEFADARKIDRAVHRKEYSNQFFDNLIDLLEKFWKGDFTKLEVVAAADDFCQSCRDQTCEGRNVADKYPQNHPNKIFWLNPGVYDAEEIKRMMKEIYKKQTGEYPPEVQ